MKTGWCKFLPLVLVVVVFPCFCLAQRVPVEFRHQGDDMLGQRIALHVKEIIRTSAALKIATAENEKRFLVIFQSKDENPNRQSESSCFGLTFILAGKDSLPVYLSSSLGDCGLPYAYQCAENVVASIEKVASERTAPGAFEPKGKKTK
jgi:hypothetical protein